MYDAAARAIKGFWFGARNTDKIVNTSDKGRVAADVGQYTNAIKAAAQLDNAVGKSVQGGLNVLKNAAAKNKVLDIAGKGADLASKNVNPLLIGASAYRVAISNDKERALKREIIGMTSMFCGEGLMNEFFKSDTVQNFKNSINNKYAKALLGAVEAGLFVAGSITCSNLGYKAADKYYGKIDEDKAEKNPVLDSKEISQKIDNEKAKIQSLKTMLNENAATQQNSTNTQTKLVA